VALSVVLALILGGCSYDKQEPGLFPRQPPRSNPAPPAPPRPSPLPPPEPTNPQLPVAGEAVWTTGDGLGVRARFAVHSVRRMPGATVLDWSVTPLAAPGHGPNDALPAGVDLGLSQERNGDVEISLVDPVRDRVYRSLSHRSAQEFHRCLCSPLWVAQLSLRIGQTRMLQVTYPELPAAVRFVDVDLATLPPFTHVPVTGLGQVPTAQGPTELRRPQPESGPGSRPIAFDYPEDQRGRRQSVTFDRVVTAPGRTSLAWTITSLTDQTSIGRLPYGSPVSAELPDGVQAVTPSTASGPVLQVGSGRPLRTRWLTDRFTDSGFLDCFCTELGIWAPALREAGGRVSVTTNYPALPRGTTQVAVMLPGVDETVSLPVTAAPDSAVRLGPATAATTSDEWVYVDDSPPSGWSTADWPTPLPRAAQLRSFTATVDDLVDLPR
jgi:hypothetical protein